MRIRRALVPLVVLAAGALSACGGDDSSGDSSAEEETLTQSALSPTATVTEETADTTSGGDVAACDLLSTNDVAAAVGSPVKEGTPSAGPSVTGGNFTSCGWQSADPDHPADTATVTIYENAAAADSVRSDSSQDLSGIGDSAFSDYAASIWVYVGEKSFFVQWYSMESSDEESLPKSEALAKAVVDAL